MSDNKGKYIFISAIIIIVIFLLLNFFIIVPSFTNILIENVEKSADKVATHLSTMVISSDNSILSPEKISSFKMLEKAAEEFNLEKISIFNESGEIVYSTDQTDIGKSQNIKEIFHILAKGEKYSNLVNKKSETTESRKVQLDVVETYVPIFANGTFIGAFEIYLEVTNLKQRLDNAVLKSSLLPLLLMFIFLVSVIFFLRMDETIIQSTQINLAKRYSSPLFFFIITAVAIFLAEGGLMMLLSVWHPLSLILEGIFDASALVLLVTPVLYFSLVMPLTSHIVERKKNEDELRRAHDELEQRVELRTAELKEANTSLEKEIAQSLEYQEQIQLSDSVLENTIEGIMITDTDGIIQRVNSSFSLITSYSEQEVIGQNPKILKSGHHDRDFYNQMWDSIIQTGGWKGEIWNRRKNGEIFPEWLSITAIKNLSGETTHYVGVFHDISDIKRAEEQLSYQVFHDALTGLPNRLLFIDRLETAITHNKRHHQMLGLLFLDLDNFKNINDSLGHNMGDMYLQAVTEILKKTCRDEDTVSRLGGDEFTVVLPNVDIPEGAVRLARRILQAFSAPIYINNHKLIVSASIGISFYPENGDNAEELIKNADIAMYHAKDAGKNRFQLFNSEMNERVTRRMILENRLRDALENNEILVYYQPKVNLISGAIVGAEALVRWQQKDGSIISPSEFIPIAEDTGLIIPVGQFVFESACNQAKEWHDAGFPIKVAVNLSTRQFRDENLLEMIQSAIKKSGVFAKAIEIEITESLLMRHEEKAIQVLQQLRKEGITVAIDDFGTGYSSLSYLKKMPINSLKIDRAFIKDVPEDEDDIALVTMIISMAESLGLTTVAEGAETIEQYDFLRYLGCSEVQGYYFSPPVVPKTLTAFLKENKKVEFSFLT